jgi:hypothetical protein
VQKYVRSGEAHRKKERQRKRNSAERRSPLPQTLRAVRCSIPNEADAEKMGRGGEEEGRRADAMFQSAKGRATWDGNCHHSTAISIRARRGRSEGGSSFCRI